MEKQIVDANVILRYLLNDNEQMSETAHELIKSRNTETYIEVIAEVLYVLNKTYGISKEKCCAALIGMLDLVSVDEKEIVIYALKLYSQKSLDFVDCMLIARNHLLGRKVFSFDKKLNKNLHDTRL